MRAFEKAPPEVGIVYTDFLIIGTNGKEYMSSARVTLKDGNIFSSLLIGKYFMTLQATVIKKECFETAGVFDENFFPIEDWELFLRMSKHYQFKYINEPLVVLYRQPDSICINKSPFIRGFKLILETYFEQISQNKSLLARYYSIIGHLSCSSGELTQGRGYFAKSIKTRPLDIRYTIAFLVSLLGRSVYNIVAGSYQRILKPL